MELLEAGKIVTTHGIKGEVRLDAWCDSPDFLLEVKMFYLSADCPLQVEASRVHKNMLNVKFHGFDSINDVQDLIGKVLYLDKSCKKLKKGTYYVADLVGLSVVDADSNAEYGTLADVLPTGANDVYEVKNKDKTYYLPAIKDIIAHVDLEGKRMLVRPIPGIFDDEI